MVAMRESVHFIKFGGNIGVNINAAKYKLLLNDFHIQVVDFWAFQDFLISTQDMCAYH